MVSKTFCATKFWNLEQYFLLEYSIPTNLSFFVMKLVGDEANCVIMGTISNHDVWRLLAPFQTGDMNNNTCLKISCNFEAVAI